MSTYSDRPPLVVAKPKNTLPNSLPAILRTFWATNRILTAVLITYAFFGLLFIGLALFDARTFLNAPIWNKPIKFAISSTIYVATLLWMLGMLTRGRKLMNWVATGVGFVLAGEIALIAYQAARGVGSHFNFATEFDGAIFAAMGSMIMMLTVLNLIIVAVLMVQPLSNRTLQLGLRLGFVITILGSLTGYLMVAPTPDQLSLLQEGIQPSVIGAHSVGVADGGPGLPFLNWSTEGGDLRVGHFVGLHAMQIVPLLALAIQYFWSQISQRRQTNLMWVYGLGYLAFLGLTVWQALRGQSIVQPDWITITTAGALLSVVVAATVAILYGGKTRNQLSTL